jgi:hypothetical protein
MAMYLDTWTCAVNMAMCRSTCAVNMDICGVPRTWPCSLHMSMFTAHVHVHHTSPRSRHMTTFTVSLHSHTFSLFVLSQCSLTLSCFHPLVPPGLFLYPRHPRHRHRRILVILIVLLHSHPLAFSPPHILVLVLSPSGSSRRSLALSSSRILILLSSCPPAFLHCRPVAAFSPIGR